MSYSFIKFNDEIIDSNVMMELTDITRLLFKNKDVSVSIRKFSYYNPRTNVMHVSTFWKHRADIEELDGFIHDVSTRFPSEELFDYTIYEKVQAERLLFQQIFLTLEYYRSRSEAVKRRPMIRKRIGQGDSILKEEYLKPSKYEAQRLLQRLNVAVLAFETHFELSGSNMDIISHSSKESFQITKAIEEKAAVEEDLKSYHQMHDIAFNDISIYNHTDPFRKDSTEIEPADEEEAAGQQTSRVDTKTDRDADDANVVGETGGNHSRKSDHGLENPYEDDVEDFHEGFGSNRGDNLMKERSSSNRQAALIVKKPKVKMGDYAEYQKIYDSYNMVAQKVIGDISQVLNYKMNAAQTNRTSGKLMKNPISPIISGSHKLFTKQNIESKEIDAAFSIILDQSFSMTENLEDSVEGIIILNNILKTLDIPHRIISHHEDSFEVMSDYYPNYIYEHLDFDKSKYYYPVSLLDMETSGDNRDGFIFRHESGLLTSRTENDRFMIIFSDGLPSAEQYNQEGITDTHEAVNEARKSGINVINIFIDRENDENTLQAIRNIYGQNTVIVREADEIPLILPNLIERILKSIIL